MVGRLRTESGSYRRLRASWLRLSLAFASAIVLLAVLSAPAFGATISGTVTDEVTGLGIQNVQLAAIDAAGNWNYASTDPTGAYAITGLLPGDYQIRTWNDQGYVWEWYDNVISQGDATVLALTGDLTGIDFALAQGLSISGTVTDEVTGLGIQNVQLAAIDAAGNWNYASTDPTGAYTITGLLPGDYRVRTTWNEGYLSEWYDNVISQGDATILTLAADVAGIDFALAQGFSISGTVTDALGDPIADTPVWAVDSAGIWFGSGTSGADGSYEIVGLPSGAYRVVTDDSRGYVNEWWDDLPTMRFAWNDAPGVDVTDGDAVGIDFSLEMGRTVSGRVTDESGAGLSSVFIGLIGPGGWKGTWTATDGTYTIRGWEAQVYSIRTWNGQGYLDEWYGGLTVNDHSSTDATPVDLSAGDATGVDFALARGLSISGVVTDEATALGIANVELAAADAVGNWNYASTDSAGAYTISGLLPADYRIRTTWNDQGYLDEWYDNVICQNDWSGTGATVVTVTGDLTGVDFALARGLSISGVVTDEATALGIANVELAAADAVGNWNYASTDSAGAYTISGLLPADYRVRTTWNDQGYLDEWYDNVICQKDPSGTGATHLTLTGDLTGIDFVLSTGRTISGVVTDDGSTPLGGVELSAVDDDGNAVGWAYTDGAGAYAFTGLYPGTFRIRTWTYWRGYGDQWYDGIRASSDPTGSDATPVDVTLLDAAGIDLALGADDVTAPDTVITGLNGGTWYNGLLSFVCTPLPAVYWRVSDNFGSEFSEVSVDNGGWQPAPGATDRTGNHSLRLGPLSDGPHSVAVRAYDYVGNVDPTPATHDFVVDTGPPSLTWDLPADGLVTTTRTVTFSGSTADAISGVKRVIIELETPSGRASFEPPLPADPDIFDYIYPSDTTWSLDVALPAGVTNARVGALDAAGNPTMPTEWRRISVDVADELPPETALNAVPPFLNSHPRFSGTATDDAGVQGVEYSLDGDPVWSPSWDLSFLADGSARFRQSLFGLAEGDHTVAFRSTDISGKVDPTPAEATFAVDGTNPTLSWDSPAPDLLLPGLTIDFSGAAADGTAGVQVVAASVFGYINPADPLLGTTRQYHTEYHEWSPVEDADIFDYIYPTAATWQGSVTLSAEGVLNLQVLARDAAGNVSPSERRRVALGVPQAQWDLPLDGTNVSDPVVTFSGSATDVGSGVQRIVLEIETPTGRVSYEPTLAADTDPFDYIYPGDTTWSLGVTLPAGTSRARMAVHDQSGLTPGPSPWRTITVATQAPQPTITAPNTGGTFAQGDVVPVAFDLAGATAAGIFHLYCWGADNTPYYLTSLPAVDGQTTYSYDWTVTQPADTGYVIRVYYMDGLGNWLYPDSSDTAFDISAATQAPQPTVTAPNTGGTFAQGDVVPVAFDLAGATAAGIFHLYCWGADDTPYYLTSLPAVDGQTTYSYDWTVIQPADTGYVIRVYYMDGVGNWLYVDSSDTAFDISAGTLAPSPPSPPRTPAAPSPKGTSCPWPSIWTGPPPPGIFHLYCWGADNTPYYLTSLPAVDGETTYSYDWTVIQPADTGYVIRVYYMDGVGNWLYPDSSDTAFDISAATLAPQPTVTAPNTGGTFAQGDVVPVAFDLDGATAAGIFHLYCWGADNTPYYLTSLPAVDGQTTYSYDWTVIQPADTGYVIRVYYMDGVGNWLYPDSSDAAFDISAATQAPQPTVTAPNTGGTFTQGDVVPVAFDLAGATAAGHLPPLLLGSRQHPLLPDQPARRRRPDHLQLRLDGHPTGGHRLRHPGLLHGRVGQLALPR